MLTRVEGCSCNWARTPRCFLRMLRGGPASIYIKKSPHKGSPKGYISKQGLDSTLLKYKIISSCFPIKTLQKPLKSFTTTGSRLEIPISNSLNYLDLTTDPKAMKENKLLTISFPLIWKNQTVGRANDPAD